MKASKETRAKMSASKRGVNHPKFKGFYVVDGVKYPSSQKAAEVLLMIPKTVRERCVKKPNKWGNFYFEPFNK